MPSRVTSWGKLCRKILEVLSMSCLCAPCVPVGPMKRSVPTHEHQRGCSRMDVASTCPVTGSDSFRASDTDTDTGKGTATATATATGTATGTASASAATVRSGQPRMGIPCGVAVDGCTLYFVNFTTADEKASQGDDANFFAMTSNFVAKRELYDLFARCPPNTRQLCTCVWLALRCDLTSSRVTGVLERLAGAMTHRTTPGSLWALAAESPMQLYVASHALLGPPLRYSRSAFGDAVHRLVFGEDVSACFDGDASETASAGTGSGSGSGSLPYGRRAVDAVYGAYEADKYPSPFLSSYILHAKARGGGGRSGAGRVGRPLYGRPARLASAATEAAGVVDAHVDIDADAVLKLGIECLIPALHYAFAGMRSASDFRTVLAFFSAATDASRTGGVTFLYRRWRREADDGIEALLLRYLPPSYAKPKVFSGTTYTAALARPTTALWWWLLKTISVLEGGMVALADRDTLLSSCALLFELSSNAMRSVEHVLLWSVFGTLVNLKVEKALLRTWLGVTEADPSESTGVEAAYDNGDGGGDGKTDAHTVHHKPNYQVPWLHGVKAASDGTDALANIHGHLSTLYADRVASEMEVAAVHARCTLTHQLQTRALVDMSDIMVFQRQLG